MTASVKAFDDKIQELKLKKKEFETKQATLLFKNAHKSLEDQFTPQLAAIIIQQSWASASKDQKEKWQKAAEKFQLSPRRKTSKAA